MFEMKLLFFGNCILLLTTVERQWGHRGDPSNCIYSGSFLTSPLFIKGSYVMISRVYLENGWCNLQIVLKQNEFFERGCFNNHCLSINVWNEIGIRRKMFANPNNDGTTVETPWRHIKLYIQDQSWLTLFFIKLFAFDFTFKTNSSRSRWNDSWDAVETHLTVYSRGLISWFPESTSRMVQ